MAVELVAVVPDVVLRLLPRAERRMHVLHQGARATAGTGRLHHLLVVIL